MTTVTKRQLTLGVPLNGILTFRGRTLPSEWQCAVCTTRNPSDEPRCSCCRQLRVVDWLRNSKGMLLQPGVVLVGHEPESAVAPSPTAKGGATAQAGDASPSRSASRGAEGDADADDGSHEEDEPCAFELAIVTSVTRVPRQVHVLAFDARTRAAAPRDERDSEPVARTLPGELARELEALDPDDPDDEKRKHATAQIARFMRFGVCERQPVGCENVYRIKRGECFLMSERERQEQMQVVARLQEQQRCERVKKDDLKAVGEKTIYADIQRCTDEILRLDKEIFRAREQLAEVQIWCPCCLWTPKF